MYKGNSELGRQYRGHLKVDYWKVTLEFEFKGERIVAATVALTRIRGDC